MVNEACVCAAVQFKKARRSQMPDVKEGWVWCISHIRILNHKRAFFTASQHYSNLL